MKLLIADDHTLFRDALVQYIERADPLSCVTLAKDFYQAMDLLEQNPYQDLVILDLRMPGMDVLNGFKVVRERFPDVPVALMSGVAEPDEVQAAIDLGAVGYFPKTMSGKLLLKAIQQVALGEVFIPEGRKKERFMPSYYIDKYRNSNKGKEISVPKTSLLSVKDDNEKSFVSSNEGDDGVKVEGLSPVMVKEDLRDRKKLENMNIKLTSREKDILSFLVKGASNKEIASSLGLQVVTVKLHVRGVCRKLGAKNRTQAALIAKEMGF